MSLSLRRPSKNNGKPTATQLEKILEDNDIEAMREYLEEGGDPDIRLQGGDKLTPLAKAETAEMAKLLLKHNADVNAKMDRGKTALLWQVLHPKPEVVKVLLEAHPSIINDKDEVGDTALHYAALHSYKSSLEIVKMLLAHRPKIDIDAKSKYYHSRDYTALDLAVKASGAYARDIIDLLLEAGADTTLHKNAEKLRNSGFLHKEYVKRHAANKSRNRRNRANRGGSSRGRRGTRARK